MKYHFVIVGQAEAGDEFDVEEWLRDSINDYNKMPPVVNSFQVFVKEVDKEDVERGEVIHKNE